MRRVIGLVVVAGCSTGPASDEVGPPFTGEVHRYVVDRFTLPGTNSEARDMGDDLDGGSRNGSLSIDNGFGLITSFLSQGGNLTTHGPDMLASGVIASSIELRADDLLADPTVGVWYYGADGEAAIPVGGTLIDGVFASNRTRTADHPGAATLHLPVFVDAAPTVIDLASMEIDLVPDGFGGYDAWIRGGLRGEDVQVVAFEGISAMVAAQPADHRVLWNLIDRDRDGVLTPSEVMSDIFIASITTPDVELRGQPDKLISTGFRVHLSPCASGECLPAAIPDRCHDRIVDGDETAIDCGGSCIPCGSGQRCVDPADCESGSCDAGTCRAATCSDGRHDGLESALDCGGPCPACAIGETCDFASDCASTHCTGGRCSST